MIGLKLANDQTVTVAFDTLPAKTRKKLLRSALRKGAKALLEKYRTIIRHEAYRTGAFVRSTAYRPMKTRRRGSVGYQVYTKTDKWQRIYQQKYGRLPMRRGGREVFFAPATIEYGSPHHRAIKPLQRAREITAKRIEALVRRDIADQVREVTT